MACEVNPSLCGCTPRCSSKGTTIVAAALRQAATSSRSHVEGIGVVGVALDDVGRGAQVLLRP